MDIDPAVQTRFILAALVWYIGIPGLIGVVIWQIVKHSRKDKDR